MSIGIKSTWILLLLLIGLVACQEENLSDCKAIQYDYELFENGPEDEGTKIMDYDLVDDCLELTVQYGGGCQEHEIDLVVGTWGYSLPPVAFSKLLHENNDPCDALVTKTLYFELESLLAKSGGDELKLAIEGFDEFIIIENTD